MPKPLKLSRQRKQQPNPKSPLVAKTKQKGIKRLKMSKNRLEIQTIVEKILAKHNIDPKKDFYLKLTMPPYMDLVLERNGDIILVGHYREENGDLGIFFDHNITTCNML